MDLEALIAGIVSFRSGRPGAELRMLSLLSATSLFVVSQEPPREQSDSSVTVAVRIGDSEGRSSAYLFSSEGLLRTWCTQKGYPAYAVQLHGGDLSIVLPKGAWVEIDPGTPHHVVLSPKQLERLGQPFDQMGSSSADETGFTSWSSRNVPQPADVATSTPAELFPAEVAADAAVTESLHDVVPQAPGAPAKKRPFMRSNPTTIFAAPTLEKKTDLESRPRTYTSSNLKKVIRPNKPDGEGD